MHTPPPLRSDHSFSFWDFVVAVNGFGMVIEVVNLGSCLSIGVCNNNTDWDVEPTTKIQFHCYIIYNKIVFSLFLFFFHSHKWKHNFVFCLKDNLKKNVKCYSGE